MGRRWILVAAAALLSLASAGLTAAPPALAASEVVLSSDFENGTTQGWVGRGSAAVALSTDVVARGDAQRNLRMHRELVEAILDNRHRRIDAAVRDHIQISASELLEILQEKEGFTTEG